VLGSPFSGLSGHYVIIVSDFLYSKYSTCSPYDRYQEERKWI
jgi:hypothetical protein